MRSIADGVWQLELVPRNAINAYLLGEVLVDTGLKQSAAKIKRMLQGRSVSAIALTHAHGDHAGAISRLAADLQVPVWCGAADRQATETGRLALPRGLRRPGLQTIANAMAGFDGVEVARELREGDDFGAGFTVLDTPGHSPGHVSFWRESDRTLICGDVFFNMNVITTVPGLHEPPDLVTIDPALNRQSERRLSELAADTVGFGHGPVMDGDAAQRIRAFVDQRR